MCDHLIVEHRNEEVLQEPNTSHSTCVKDLVSRICAGTGGVGGVKQTRHVKKSEIYNTQGERRRHVNLVPDIEGGT